MKIIQILWIVVLSWVSIGYAASPNEKSDGDVAVACPNNVDRRFLRETEDGVWCDSVFLEVCSKDKLAAARKVCTSSYKTKLSIMESRKESIKPTDNWSAEKLELQKELEQVTLEKQRIALKVRQLDVKKRKLMLNKTENDF